MLHALRFTLYASLAIMLHALRFTLYAFIGITFDSVKGSFSNPIHCEIHHPVELNITSIKPCFLRTIDYQPGGELSESDVNRYYFELERMPCNFCTRVWKPWILDGFTK